MSKLPRTIRKAGRKILDQKDRLMSRYWLRIVRRNPEKHAMHEMRRQKQNLIRPVNLQNPVYFHEKTLWLTYFVYNNSPLVAQCYNKYEVRDYLIGKGLGHILNELYGVWESVEEIPWDDLPDEYVMKISNGYGNHVFKRKGQEFSVEAAKKQLRKMKDKYSYYYMNIGNLFVGKTKQHIICEKMLYSRLGRSAPEDYKFHCFNGKPMFIEFIKDRENTSSYKSALVDMEFHDRHDLEGEASPGTIDPPKCYEEMLEIAKVLSADFPYVRVDLYDGEEHPVFGELTFTPFYKQTRKSQIELGKMLNIENIDEYKSLLKHRAARKESL